ncbi:trinucleotide repeat-containing gene 6C protein-like isoform X2 [Acipenser ruthenus]|uniref:trinucleotide repeat-containing gene 6C protein-like isoform X2 n=1 Tax=Acipenser ruthenus TaxID=7906 RepID=UPI00274129EC|nr:trinucleotide repeat-containing gene 6C protein-like isoform X2 [Acipenser ruthenus]
MEEKKKKKQEEKKKKEAAHRKAAEQKTKVPVSAKLSPSSPHPANPSVTPPIPTVSSSGNGKRAPPSAQQQQQQQPPPAAPRFPPREVPPRFRQQEHKQLLKRGQPLPAGTLATTGQPGASSPPQTPASPSKQHTELPHQSGLGTQYENLHWGHQPSNRIWDQVIIDQSDTEAWPSISYSESHAAPECTTDIDCTTEISSSNMSIATGAGQQSHFSAHHPSSKNSSNHSENMVSNQGGASRGWGAGPTHCPSAISSEGKTDSMPMGGRGQPCWGSSNFNLNLNPNANPAAWPVLGHEGAGMGGGGPGGNNPPPPLNLCSPASAPSVQERGGSMGSTNGNPVGGSGNSAWGSILPPDPTESRHSPSTNVSFSVEPQNLNTDGPNNTKQQSLSPIHGLPSWGSVPVDMGPLVQPQVNGEGGSVWGNGDAKPTGSKDSAWDSGPPSGPGILTPWGQGGSNAGAWGRSACSGGGDWGKHSSEAKGWETSDSPRQEQSVSWSNTPASEGSNDSLEGRSRRMERPHGELDAPPSLPRQDLDPRVLSNTGWGQTPVRQHTAWELEEMARSDRKNDTGADSWSTGSSSSSSSGPPPAPATVSANPAAAHMSNSGGKGKGSSSNTSAAPGWGNPALVIATPASSQPSSSWGEALSKKAPSGPGGCAGSSNSTGPKGGMSWDQEEKSPSWDDPPAKPKPQSWGEGPKPGHGWGTGTSGGGDWGEPREEKKNDVTAASWEENPRNAGWGKPGQGAGAGAGVGGGWMETQRPSAPVQGWGGKPQDSSNSNVESWGGAGTVKQCGTGWGGGGGGGGGRVGGGGGSKQEQGSEPTGWEEPSPPSMRRKMEIDDGTSAWGDPSTYNKTVNLWDKNNPVIQSSPGNAAASNNHGNAAASNNHGNAAASNNHGNAAASNNHGNAAASNNHGKHAASNSIHHHHHSSHAQNHSHAQSHSQSHSQTQSHNHTPGHSQSHTQNHSHTPSNTHNSPHEQTTPHQPSAPQNRSVLAGPGWGDLPSARPKPEPSWGEPVSPATAVDNGTSAWGKPPGSCGGWGDNPSDPSGPYGRVNPPSGPAPCKPASKSMQDGWGGSPDELGGWDREEGDVWNSATSQESNSPCSSWGNLPKKGPQKVIKVPSKQDEAWILSRLIKQLTDMGFPREPAEEALKSNSMNLDQAMSALLEKKSELDRRGMGMCDYNGLLSKPLGCRPPAISKESSSDRSPFLDKDGGLVEDAPASPFLPSPSLKLPLSSSALPNQALGGVPSGLAMQNMNNRQMQSSMFGNSGAAQFRAMQQQQQPAVPPLNSSQPSVRAQVPQFLSPQVQAQLLQFAAKNIGLNPALLTSPMNPQHMTLLNQLYQLQLSYQRLQIQQQMLQAQRSVSGPMRQQEQQVARTINNMQQQIQQHQRQLAQALLMKQQPPPHPGMHPGTGKSALDSFPPHLQAPGLPDLQTKEQQCSPNSFSPHPLSGLNPNMNVNSMDVGSGLSMKDSSQSQSRLPQWTHPNSMENLSGTSSPLEQNLSKHGAIPAGPSIGPPGKSPMDDSYSPYNLIPSSESPASPLVAPDNWTQAKSANDKICNGTNISWPPEFCPGVPWKGLQNIDPETDPNVTPGSVPSGPTINTNIQDVNRYLLRDRSGGKLSDMKSTWSPGPISHPQASLSHELWKVPQGPRNPSAPTRPPPGLTNTKPSSTWGGNSLGLTPGWSSSYTSGTTWSTDSSARTSSWLVLRNLTPQIDGSTLRTLCMQHGPLLTFHLNLTQGNAVVRYSSKEEAAKAQKSLHMCVLGNTTILAEFAGEEDVNRFFAQGQSLTPTTSWQAHPGTNQTRLGGAGHWNSGGGKGGSELLWGGVPQYSSLWGPPGGEDSRGIGSPTPINTLLPGDLLSGETM